MHYQPHHQPHRRLLTAIATVAVATGLLAACGDDDNTSTSKPPVGTSAGQNDPYGTAAAPAGVTTPAPGGTASGQAAASTVTISGFNFVMPDQVAAGAEISVTNDDGAPHTFTADDGSFDVSVSGGKTATVKAPAKAGSYALHCNIHTSMKATLVVS